MNEAALSESGGGVTRPSGAAVKLGISGSTLDTKIRSLKIEKDRFESTNPSTDRTLSTRPETPGRRGYEIFGNLGNPKIFENPKSIFQLNSLFSIP